MTNQRSEPVVRELLEQALREAGFSKIRSQWVRETSSSYHMSYVQRSYHGPYYFLNFGIRYKVVEPGGGPRKTQGSHLEFRPGDTRSEVMAASVEMLDESKHISAMDRSSFIRNVLFPDAEETFRRYESVQDACKLARTPIAKRQTGSPTIHRKLLNYCGVSFVDPEY